MEQVFIILAIIVYWIFRGVSGAQRRLPGQDPSDTEGPVRRGPMDIAGTARQSTVEAQQRALEALQRWEAKQGLSSASASPEKRMEAGEVPAADRTRVGRPARIASRTTAERRRRQAYAEIAQMLEPAARSPGAAARPRQRFTVGSPAPAPEDPPEWEERPTSGRIPSPAAQKRVATRKLESESKIERKTAPTTLSRLEKLPFPARAIVYAEILGRPRSLS